LGTLFSASASSASMVSDINATPVSGRHQMESLDTSDSQPASIHSSHSATNLETVSDTATVTFDTASLNSAISGHESTNSGQPSSLLSSATATNRPCPTFIPHIVFLNSILNYLSVSAVAVLVRSFSKREPSHPQHQPAKMAHYT